MKSPDHPVRPAFDKAADALDAWRKRQHALLTEAQKQEFRKRQAEAPKALREYSRDFYQHEQERIEAAKQRLMLEKPDLALRMLPTEGMREARAYHLARGMVDQTR